MQKYTKNYRKNLEIYWQQYFCKYAIPKGYHVHHIIPKSVCKQEGWNDMQINHPHNLIALHPDDHFTIHKCRGDKILNEKFMIVLKNYKHSEETKRKISQANTGFRHSEETKLKMSKSQRGSKKPKTQSAIDNIQKSRKGYRHSEETKLKMSKTHKGKPKSDETRQKMSISAKTRSRQPHSEETKLKMSKTHKGKPKSDETRQKMSDSKKRYWTMKNKVK